MNRRQFLTRALVGVPLVLAPVGLVEALAPKRTIFLPPRGGWLRHTYTSTIEYAGVDNVGNVLIVCAYGPNAHKCAPEGSGWSRIPGYGSDTAAWWKSSPGKGPMTFLGSTFSMD